MLDVVDYDLFVVDWYLFIPSTGSSGILALNGRHTRSNGVMR
jgi:hypothetical protein